MGKRRARKPTLRERWDALWECLFAPVDIASLAFARIAFGLAVAWEAYRFLYTGQVDTKFLAPAYLLPWRGLEWLTPWPGDGLYLHFWAIVLLGVCFAAGLLYRLVAPLFFLAILYVFLLTPTAYMNHTYLQCLLALLFCPMPAHHALSVDAWLRPALRCDAAPAWTVWLLRFQMSVVYFFGGLAKLQGDWLQGYPMRIWLPPKANLPLLGPLFETSWVPVLMSWSGLLIDLLAAPALLSRKTRPYAFAVLVSFHCWNSQLFSIGVFPWMAIALTTIFFEPDWPRRVFRWPASAAAGAAGFLWSPARVALAGFLTAYAALQLLVPLRHYVIEGDASWTGEGHRFAWRMMLRDNRGLLSYSLSDPDTGETWLVNPREELKQRQYRKLAARPDLIHQYAEHLAALARGEGRRRVEVRALVLASLNGRAPQPLVDREVDLTVARQPWLAGAWWIPSNDAPLGSTWHDERGAFGAEDPVPD